MSSQIQITGETKVKSLTGVLVGTTGVVSSLAFDVAGGVPKLDVNGKILVSQLPNSVMEYKGTWSAATNTPTLANGTGNQGDVYLCNVAGTVDFGAGAIAFVVGDQVIYSGSIWQRASGATGTVTSVAVTESGDSLNITGSPITTSGTINIGFNGTNLQYVNGAGNLTTFPTLITSIGLSMPSAFSVANSPLTANGTIAVTGAGVASQYIRGDGTLADFPSSGGGGSSVSYYLNGGTSQGTIGGTTYYEMSKTAVIGTGVDFAKSGDGFIVAFLTDANDPAQLNIPAGNWNYEIYASMSSNGGTPELYAELYKYDGTTFTLIATSPHEILYDGTALNLYTFAMAVPATSLTLTDRLAVKLYATNSGGKTTTIHTQDGHLCQIITTFSTGITALNGLTAQVQYFQTGTSGTDFNISSTTATHTFNIPDASATARGLITTGTQTIAGTKTFSDATKNNGGIFLQNGSSGSTTGYMNFGGTLNGVRFTNDLGISNSFTLPSATGYTFTFPNATGTIALTSDISYPVTSVFGRTGAVVATSGDYTTAQVTESGNLYFTDSRARLAISLTTTGTSGAATYNNTTGVFNIPNYAPDLSGYVTLAGTQTITGAKTFSTFTKFDGGVILKNNVSASLAGYVGLSAYSASGNKGINIDFDTYSCNLFFNGTLPYSYTFPNANGTIALTSDLSSYLPLTGGTLTGGLIGQNATFDGNLRVGTLIGSLEVGYASAIGTYKLDVNGTGRFSSSGSSSVIVQRGNTSSGATIDFSTSTTNKWFMGLRGLANDDFYIFNQTAAANNLILSASTGAATFSGSVAVGASTSASDFRYYPVSSASGNSVLVLKDDGADGTLDICSEIIGNANAASSPIAFRVSNVTAGRFEAMRITNTGNLGLGVTPSAWAVKAIDISTTGAVFGDGIAFDYTAGISQNCYRSGNTTWNYKLTGVGTSRFELNGNIFSWYQVPSGTAGNAITFTQAMTLDASGRLGIGVTPVSQSGGAYAGSTEIGGILRIQGGGGRYFTSGDGMEISKTSIYSYNRGTGSYNNIGINDAMTIIGGGNVLIGTTTDAGYKLDVNGTGRFSDTLDVRGEIYVAYNATYGLRFYNNARNNWSSIGNDITGSSAANLVFKTGGGTALTLDNSRAATFSSSVTASSFFESSDSRLKTLIQDNYQTKGIASITPKLYTKNGKVELGYYAQDFVGILDSAVSKGSDDMLSLSYREVLVAKVYALEQRIKELETK